jgi:3-dehydrosphinganine reductase
MKTLRHAIVTGGSSGIGLETARLLVRRGSSVTLLARRLDTLQSAKDDLERDRAAASQQVLTLSVDVADREAVTEAIARAERDLGPCDLAVTSAGIAHPGYFAEVPVEVFERTMDVNYLGTLYTLRAVLPGMRSRRRGHVVLVSSGAGIVGVFGYAAYSPSKFALRGLAEVLRGELVSDGVSVSIVYPPDTDTPQLTAENEIKPAETRAITSGAKTWKADAVARCILDGVDRDRFAITPGWEMTWLHRVHSVARPLLAWHFDRTAARARPGR